MSPSWVTSSSGSASLVTLVVVFSLFSCSGWLPSGSAILLVAPHSLLIPTAGHQPCFLWHTTRHSMWDPNHSVSSLLLACFFGVFLSLLILILCGRLLIILSHFLLIIQCGTLIIPSTPSFWLASLEFYYLILHLLLILLYWFPQLIINIVFCHISS